MKPELNERIGSYVIDLSLPPSSDALTSFIEIHCNPLQSIGIHWNPLESVGIRWDWNTFLSILSAVCPPELA